MPVKPRRRTRAVAVGALAIGGDNPVWVQSMTTTDPADLDATLPQVRRLEDAGCEIIRTAVLNKEQAAGLGALRRHLRVPLVADIHFDYRLALLALEQGVDKVRVNPGNIGGEERFREVIRAAKASGAAMRIGVNSGSMPAHILARHGHPTPAAFVDCALEAVRTCEDLGYNRVVLSLKSSDTATAVAAYRLFSERSDYPLHLGITEAGDREYGAIKSAVGLGALLLDGIGDTIRVSLTGDPVAEIPVAYDILKSSGARVVGPEIVSCPTCGRIQVDLEPVVRELKERLKGRTEAVRVSVLGCAVNGPGEAAESDVGVAGGKDKGLVYRRGKLVRTVPADRLVAAVLEEVEAFLAERTAGKA